MWNFDAENEYMRKEKWRFQQETTEKVKVWFDCEFIDGNTLDLISIGLVSENGVEYYAVCSEFDENKADQWIKDNIVPVLGTKDRKTKEAIREDLIQFIGKSQPEFWSYFGAHDWVVLCQLFGGLFKLPQNWPQYCKDLKQWADDLGDPKLPTMEMSKRHNALFDAQWHQEVWYFLNNLEITSE